jgi:hypothetical protein
MFAEVAFVAKVLEELSYELIQHKIAIFDCNLINFEREVSTTAR